MTLPFFNRRRQDQPRQPALRLFVPKDAAAVAVGADSVAASLARQAEAAGFFVEIIRTGSRGMLWLEPLVEIEVAGVRHGFGPVEPDDVDSLIAAGLFRADLPSLAKHPAALGIVDKLEYLARQTRLTFARCGVIDPHSLED